MLDRNKMLGFMMDMCCKGVTEEDKQKMKNMCRDLAGQFPSCCKKMDVSSFMKHCLSGSEPDKNRT